MSRYIQSINLWGIEDDLFSIGSFVKESASELVHGIGSAYNKTRSLLIEYPELKYYIPGLATMGAGLVTTLYGAQNVTSSDYYVARDAAVAIFVGSVLSVIGGRLGAIAMKKRNEREKLERHPSS